MKSHSGRYGSIIVIALGIVVIAGISGFGGSRILNEMSAHEESARQAQNIDAFALHWSELMLAWDRTLSTERAFVDSGGTAEESRRYLLALHRVRAYFALLRVSATDSPSLQTIIAAVEPLVSGERRRLDAHLDASTAGGAKVGARAAPMIVDSVEGTVLDEIESNLQEKLLSLHALQSSTRKSMRQVLIFSGSSILAVLFIMGVTVITELLTLKRLGKRLLHEARHDVLTGLPNRAFFEESLRRSLANAARFSRKVGLIYIDLNGFKQVNDKCGHEAGDEVLKQTARSLESMARAGDLAARLGGDEFAILLPETSGPAEVERIAQRYRALRVENSGLFVTGSAGCSVFPDQASNAAELMRAADERMFEDKASDRLAGSR